MSVRYFNVDRTHEFFAPDLEEVLNLLAERAPGVEIVAERIAKGELTHRIRFDGAVEGWVEVKPWAGPAEIARIAAGMTAAQRKWLPWFKPEPFGGYPIGMSKRTLDQLIERGLIDKHRPAYFGAVKWSLSATGQYVAAYLKEQERG